MSPTIGKLTIAANAMSFHALAAGPADGPLMLMLHGFPETSHGWSKQIVPLAEAGLRVVAPDLRGIGLSSKPAGIGAYRVDALAADVAAMIRALGRERACIVGHDWGGVVAWHLAEHHADVVERVAILGAPHPAVFSSYLLRHPWQAGKSWYLAFFQLPWAPEAILGAANFEWLAQALTTTSRPGAFSSVDLRVYREAWSQPGALTGMINWYRALPLGSKAPRPDALITMPVRLLWGDKDTVLEPGLAEASIARCGAGEVFHLPDATHWLQHEEPARVNALLLDFMR
ncbi:MAG: alpha/beta hydrolase [Burkholderiaceae bacterium]